MHVFGCLTCPLDPLGSMCNNLPTGEVTTLNGGTSPRSTPLLLSNIALFIAHCPLHKRHRKFWTLCRYDVVLRVREILLGTTSSPYLTSDVH